jgi:hypothetical protein
MLKLARFCFFCAKSETPALLSKEIAHACAVGANVAAVVVFTAHHNGDLHRGHVGCSSSSAQRALVELDVPAPPARRVGGY